MVTLQALDPIWVDFPMPEQNIGKLKTGQVVELTVDAFPGKIFKGSVTSLDARVAQERAHCSCAAPSPIAISRCCRACLPTWPCWRALPPRS